MKIELGLFGAFRDFDQRSRIDLELAEGARVSDLRQAVQAYGEQHWPDFRPELLSRSAFASEVAILRDSERLPACRQMVLLPPVSGG